MQIRVDVYDPSWAGLGTVQTAIAMSAIRSLDGAGSFTVSVPAHDRRAVELFTNECRVVLLVDDGSGLREVTRGIVRDIRYSAQSSGWELKISGPDVMDELKRRTVKFNAEYEDVAINTIVADLVALVPGWSSSCSITDKYTGRFDGVSVLKALQSLAEYTGNHLRVEAGGAIGGTNVLEFGAFGADLGLRLRNGSRMPKELRDNPDVAHITNFEAQTNTKPIVNRLYALGAGANVDSALNLGASTRTSPTIHSETVNGRTMYYIEDSASIAQYGRIEQIGQFKEIQSLGNTDALIELAANALHDAASAWLERHAVAENRYSVQIMTPSVLLTVGDKVELDYIDALLDNDGLLPVQSVQGDFYVMRVMEAFNMAGSSVSLDIADVDRHDETIAKTVVGALEAVRLNGMVVQPTFNHYLAGPEQVIVNGGTNGFVYLQITDAVTEVVRVKMRVRTKPFTATAKPANHRHSVFQLGGNIGSGFPVNNRVIFGYKDAAGTISAAGAINYTATGDPVGTQLYTYGTAAGLEYGIYYDTVYPASMSIRVNGVLVASGVGTIGAAFEAEYDITDEINGKAGGFRGTHEIKINPASGRGEVIVYFDVYELITPFRLG